MNHNKQDERQHDGADQIVGHGQNVPVHDLDKKFNEKSKKQDVSEDREYHDL